MNDFNEYLDQERRLSVAALTNLVADWREQAAKIDAYYAELLALLDNYLISGGKFHRPLLVRLGYGLVKPIETEIVKKSVVTEILHRFFLIHDDIIDQDQIRHGMPTIQARYSQYFKQRYPGLLDNTFSLGMQMIGGDLLQAKAFQLLADEPMVVRAIFSDIEETCAGWVLETNLKQKALPDVRVDDVIKAMTLVSAQYSVVWPLRIGQILAGKTYGQWDRHVDEYGLKTGLAFQLTDDLLGLFGKPEVTGKPVGNDLREGKKSLVLVKGFELAGPNEKRELERALWKKPTADRLARVQSILQNSGALDWTKNLARQYADEAMMALAAVRGSNLTVKNRLAELAHYLADRER